MLDGDLGLSTTAKIGPNAILQLQRPVADILGRKVLGEVLNLCQVNMPSGDEMIPEEDVALVHHTLRRLFPDQMAEIARRSGRATARYIRAHRIPAPARLALSLLPWPLAERILTSAILAHAWTFCGSGTVTAQSRWGHVRFALIDNPLVDHHWGADHQCGWHEAVFEELYSSLLGTPYKVREVACCGCGAPACIFEVERVG